MSRVTFPIVGGAKTLKEIEDRRMAALRHSGIVPLPLIVQDGGRRIEVPMIVVHYHDMVEKQQFSRDVYFSGYLPSDFDRLDSFSTAERTGIVLIAETYRVEDQTGLLSVPAKYADLAHVVAAQAVRSIA